MPRRRGIMSEELKAELAAQMGVAEQVRRDGWGSVPSAACGSLTKLAVAMAQQQMASQTNPYGRR